MTLINFLPSAIFYLIAPVNMFKMILVYLHIIYSKDVHVSKITLLLSHFDLVRKLE